MNELAQLHPIAQVVVPICIAATIIGVVYSMYKYS